MIVFEIENTLGKKIRLTDLQLMHIISKHSEILAHFDRMKEVLIDPDIILFDEEENNFYYAKFYTKTVVSQKFLLLVVKHLNGEGYIITAFLTKKLKEGRVIWKKR